ncbi:MULTISPECIES: rhamnulokinase family protein [unclassified Streptococcus]|uniref:rhamnulokinase n=1 Tax=unclassified Streptococcus TaxID=2608887 RepID=UPI0010723343|nr:MULTISPECIES: rhamnulokinase family protein [unclassified Streptococcus]MBF0787315.1 rhamnulokinase [Streptococcus sp. 19428wC2_LYSM12]MCQ9212654.1 rhamnulokinase [Streptococcus sp. B01]MCQ9213993.1 rhamnulokinase [Streptococcus sp. O1]TFV05801.1 rhamnulokinase [Streptococcus sp. LYSM12]
MKAVLAMDFGATSGRAVLASVQDDRLVIEEINRFQNSPIRYKGHLCWDLPFLFERILESIDMAQEKAELLSVGIDTWGVDYGLLDGKGELITSPVHYRDCRTKGIVDKVSEYFSLTDLYAETGNQLMEMNTLFQLVSSKSRTPSDYFQTSTFLLMPDLFNYLLTGQKVAELSIASTTQMLSLQYKNWNEKVLKAFDIPLAICPPLVKEGVCLGVIKKDFQKGSVQVVTVLSHDTASAIASIPLEDQSALFISSGTWSLIGILLDKPIINEASQNHQFTNELGEDGQITFLKNCTGLWIVEELRREYASFNQPYSYDEIASLVQEDTDIVFFDTDSPEFAEPGEMIAKIQAYAERTGQELPVTPASLFKSAYHSLAKKYHDVVVKLEALTEKTYSFIYLIGGGSKSSYLAQLTADMTGKEVLTGLSEATAIGNSLVQLVAMGQIKDMTEARQLVAKSFPLTRYQPKSNEKKVSVEHDPLS